MQMITLAQYCLTGAGHDLSYHEALQQLKGGAIEEVITYMPKMHTVQGLPSTWQRFFAVPKQRFAMFPLRLLDYIRMYRLAKNPTVFFLETFNVQDFIAFLISTLIFSAKDHKICILYRDGKEWSLWRRRLQQFVSCCFERGLSKRYIPLTDSAIVARDLGKKVMIVPIPHVQAREVVFVKKKGLILWFPGAPRAEKGIAWIQYLAQTHTDDEVELLISEEASLPESRLHVTFLKKFMPREVYVETLHLADVILLPYEARLYRSRTSGPFVEAIVAGKWVLTTQETWMAYELLQFGLEELIVDWHDPLILQHLKEVISNPLVQEKMRKMSLYYQQFHSQKSFEDRLKNHLASNE